MKSFILFSILFALSASTVFAQNAEQLLARDIMTSQKILKADIKLYNYFFMEKVWPGLETESGREAFTKNYLSVRAGSFWDAEFSDASPKNYATGPGLYFAIDPHISQKYGNSFIELTVPAGTKFINVVAPIVLKKDTMAALMAESLITKADIPVLFPKQSGFYRDTLRAMVLPQYSAFRKVVQNIFEANGIQFIEYNFNTSLSGFCTKNSYSAFDYVGTKNPESIKNAIVTADFSNLAMYSTVLDIPDQPSEIVENQNEIVKFRTMLQDIVDLRAAKKAVKKEFILSRYTAEEYKAIKARTFSCE